MDESLAQVGLAAALLAIGAAATLMLRLPALPAYLAIGVIIGPRLHVDALQPLPDLGLLLLLFAVGLEFGPDRLKTLGRRRIIAGLWDAATLPIGTLLGLLIGLDLYAAILLGSAVYVSSSAVIAKTIIDLGRAPYAESEVVLSVLVFEDLVIAVVLAVAAGHGGMQALLGSLVLIVIYVVVGHMLGPRLANWVTSMPSELLLLAGTALIVGTAELFRVVGASESVGAFLAGILAASLGMRESVERLFGPIRDLAAAFFFLTVGATARATLSDISWLAISVAVLAPLVKLPLNYLCGAAAGLGQRGRLLTAVYLIPRGEFSLVLSSIALASGAVLVGQAAVLMVLLTVPLGVLLIQAGPGLTRRIKGRRLLPFARLKPPRTTSDAVRRK